ncbi:cyclic diguanylate phosphodiesterase (EAL) domain protein [Leptospira santarosai str. ST188]|uniref:GGDEF domain-containing protein n=1 Tax=Leptospira santarosai TaxID=28183 RepID=A0AB73LPB2_9LEPT|nr:Cyclic diguanylate phosphodiesterase (EAL) domain protein [Leptospira santarosai]EKS10417.1 cyclic diguanylate phosphodiesterase (EAL) domain protein [Leptospira santarosai str. JET]EMF88701.1 cyclic diguanylate phosphodiesterase (EAL) domain protein [Leptospira santarosai str. ST188]EMI62196.1 cyclic diguanylate phosphodiesterase (EAL) domain protein [Leptospira sp. Fiocruz LV4135]ONF94273.1 GGDEF domain-containing protein [Leptospira santarosai]
MGIQIQNLSPSLQKSLLYFSDQSTEGIVVLDRDWKTVYANHKFQNFWSFPNFQVLYEKIIPLLKSKEKQRLEDDTNISHLLQEIEDPEDSFLGETNFQLQLSVHDFEDSYMIRFKPQSNAQPKKEYETGHWDRNTNLPNQKYFLNHFGKQITEDEFAMNGHFSFLISISNPDSIVSQENNSYFEYIYQKVADRLKKYLNRNDHLFRIESDKFLIVSAHVDSEIKAEWFAECIRMLFDFPFTYEKREFHLNVNLGYTQFDSECGSDMNALGILKEALHRSNLLGPNSSFYYDQNAIAATSEKAKIEIDLRKVLNRNELEIHFQPIVDLKENRFFSMETLVRWNHPEKGKLLPGSFISIAESSSFIKTIGEWMIWETFRYYENSILKSENISLSLNISPKQLGDKNIFPLLKEASDYYKIQPDHIILEIVEDSFDSRESQIGKVIASLKDYGFKFAIDDFGKGYSSLGRLIHLPIDYIKLDKMFLFNYFQTSTRAVITSMVNLVQAMGKAIIVEGVENKTQHELLRELNCNFGQGYYYSHPMEIELAEKLVRNKEIPFS